MHYYGFVIVSLIWLAFFSITWLFFCYKFTRFIIYFLFLFNKGPTLVTLEYNIHFGSMTNLFIFRFVSLLCLRSTLHLLIDRLFVERPADDNVGPKDKTKQTKQNKTKLNTPTGHHAATRCSFIFTFVKMLIIWFWNEYKNHHR